MNITCIKHERQKDLRFCLVFTRSDINSIYATTGLEHMKHRQSTKMSRKIRKN